MMKFISFFAIFCVAAVAHGHVVSPVVSSYVAGVPAVSTYASSVPVLRSAPLVSAYSAPTVYSGYNTIPAAATYAVPTLHGASVYAAPAYSAYSYAAAPTVYSSLLKK